MSREMKIDNSFSERRIYRARSKAGMDRDLVTKYFQCSKIYINCTMMIEGNGSLFGKNS